MWTRIKALRVLLPKKVPFSWRQVWMSGGILTVAVLAYFIGQWRAGSGGPTQTIESKLLPHPPVSLVSKVEDPRAPVARIYNGIPITRQELGDYLIDRHGGEKVEFLIHRKILDHALQQHGISISDAQIDAQLIEDLKAMNIVKLDDFVNVILKKVGKSLYEYKQDVIYPKIGLTLLSKGDVTVSEQDVKDAFEAKYGPKVQCRIIALAKDVADRDGVKIWQDVQKDEATFKQYAREKNAGPLAASGGEVPPIHKHFGDKTVEAEAFSLREGEVSSLIRLPDGSGVILKCDKHLPADKTHRLDDEFPILRHEVAERKLAEAIPKLFKEMRDKAAPKVLLPRETGSDPTAAKRINMELIKAAAARNKIEMPPPLPPLPEFKKK